MTTLMDRELRRARWRRVRRALHLNCEAEKNFAIGGVAQQVDDLAVRVVFLPCDPELDVVQLNADLLAWLEERRASPYGGNASWGSWKRTTTDVALLYDSYRDDATWKRYLAVPRHGGVDTGIGNLAYEVRETRVFPLRAVVALVWRATALQRELIERFELKEPWEVSVAIRNARNATLGSFAEGWAELGNGLWDPSTCVDDHVHLRFEYESFPDSQEFAFSVGDRLENAFGTTDRRYLAHRGQYKDQFDPRGV